MKVSDIVSKVAVRLIFDRLKYRVDLKTALAQLPASGGGTPSRNNPEYFSGDIPWFTGADFSLRTYRPQVAHTAREYITSEAIENSSTKLLPPGTVLLTTRVSVGKVAIADCDVTTNQDFRNFLPTQKIIPRYLAYFLIAISETMQSKLRGTTIKGITLDALNQEEIPLVSQSEQLQIIDYLDELDEHLPLSEKLKDVPRIVAQIDALATQIEEARGFRRSALEEGEALFTSAMSQLIDDELNNDWIKHTLEDACEAIIDYRGKTPLVNNEGGIPYITSANIRNGKIDWKASRFFTKESYDLHMTRGFPRVGDVVFTMEAPLGETGLIEDDRVFGLAQRLILLRGKPHVLSGQFLSRVLMSPLVRKQIYARATGTTVKGIASKRLQQIAIPIPPLQEQKWIVAQLDALQAQLDSLRSLQRKAAAELDALLPSILDRAFRGEL